MVIFDHPEQKGNVAKVPGSEMARERKGQRANWPESYWPIRSGQRMGPGAKRLGTPNLYDVCNVIEIFYTVVNVKFLIVIQSNVFWQAEVVLFSRIVRSITITYKLVHFLFQLSRR